MRPVPFAPFGITVFPSTWMGAVRVPAKVSPTLFLFVASVWPTVALIAVPFGTVTIAVGCGALAAAAGFAASGFLAAAGFLPARRSQPPPGQTNPPHQNTQEFPQHSSV